jgi:hypothetical protein
MVVNAACKVDTITANKQWLPALDSNPHLFNAALSTRIVDRNLTILSRFEKAEIIPEFAHPAVE